MDTEAAAILLAVERLHIENDINACSHCHEVPGNQLSDYWVDYPCPTLLAARAVASKETLTYVAVQLALENGRTEK